MQFKDLEIQKLLPLWMQDDNFDYGLSKSSDQTLKEIYDKIPILKKWNAIDQMSEAQVDALAWELNIPWYMSNADLETKRKLVKESDLVHAKLGTDWAVAMVIQTYFGTGEVKSWFDYGGLPYHFRVETTEVQKVADNYLLFLDLLSKVKRCSAVLDATVIKMTDTTEVYVGFCWHELTIERVTFQDIEEAENGN